MRVFDFGTNWRAFTEQHIDEQRLVIARQSLQNLLGRERLDGDRLLDVGCGSGLFSVAATRLGTAEVVGTDINPTCIAVSEQNRAIFAPQANARFLVGSALEPDTMAHLGQFDIVYAWGSLHHTGAMWDAIRNTSICVAPGGTLVLAIYNKHSTSPIWRIIKRTYNQAPGFIQRIMIVIFAIIIYIAKFIVTRRNPLEKERGMVFWYDIIDWVGGYPYEYATPQAIQTFVEAQDFQMQRLVPAQVPTGCNEFVFKRV